MSDWIILSVEVDTANDINDSLGVLATGLGVAKYRLFKWRYDRRRSGNYNCISSVHIIFIRNIVNVRLNDVRRF